MYSCHEGEGGIEYAKRNAELVGKNVAPLLKIGVKGEQGKDNREVHKGTK